jgi:ABC-type transport system substrate-binding protein
MNQVKGHNAKGHGARVAAAVCSASLVVAFFAGSVRAQGSGSDTLHVVVTPPPRTFDVMGTNKANEARVAALVHERLLFLNAQTKQIEPGVAAKWEATDKDKKVWKLWLNPAKTPDGRQVTAEDVIFSLERITSQDYCPQNYSLFIVGDKPIKAESTDDGRAVVVRLEAPYPLLPETLTNVPVVPADAFRSIATGGKAWRSALDAKRPGEETEQFLRGFGPYYVKKRTQDNIEFEANPYYHGKAADGSRLPRTRRLELHLRQDFNVVKQLFTSNNLCKHLLVDPTDMVDFPPSAYSIDKRAPQDVVIFCWWNLNQMTQNASPPVVLPGKFKLMNEENFRRTVSGLLDRDAFVSEVLDGFGKPAHGPYSVQSPSFADNLRSVAPPALTADQAITALREVGVSVEMERSFKYARFGLVAIAALGLGVVAWRRAARRPDGRLKAATPWALAAVAVLVATLAVPGVLWSEPAPVAYYEEDGRPTRLTFNLITPNDRGTVSVKACEWVKARLAPVGIDIQVVSMKFDDVVPRLDDPPRAYEMALMKLESPKDTDVITRFHSMGGMCFPNNRWDGVERKDSEGKDLPREPDPKARHESWQKELDGLAEQCAREMDASKRRLLQVKIQEIHARHVPVLYLAVPQQILVQRTDAKLEGMATSSAVFEPVLDRPFVENVRVLPQR